MIQFDFPLKERMMNQPYGVDWVGGGFYQKWGFKGHFGWDLRCPEGTTIYACYDGTVKKFIDGCGGIVARLIIEDGNDRYIEVDYAHLSHVTKEGKVKKGDAIGLTGNTGCSQGPHLHYDVRIKQRYSNGAEQVLNYNNGYKGHIDPSQFYPKDIWYHYRVEFKLPVDHKYGEKKAGMTWLEWLKASKWIWKSFRRLMTDREMKALRYGYWGIREVLDPTMYGTWTKETKPSWLSKMGKL